MLTREEKEKRVIELLKAGNNYRYIAKEVHISLRDISAINKRYFGESQVKPEQEQTIDTRVFRLFEEGKSPVQVAIELDLKSEEVTKLYKEWWRLKGLQQLSELHEEIGEDIFELHRTYKFVKDHGYIPRQLIETADHLDELPVLRSENEQLVEENENLENQKWNKKVVLEQTNQSIATAQQQLTSINAGIQENKEEIARLNNERLRIQTIIASLNTSAGYQQTQRVAESSARSVLNQNQVVLTTACRAIFQALKEEPRNELEFLVYGSLSNPFYEPGTGRMPQNYLQHRQAVLVYAAEEIYKNLLAKLVNTTTSSLLYPQSGQLTRWSNNP